MTRIRIEGRDSAVTAVVLGIVGFFTLGVTGPLGTDGREFRSAEAGDFLLGGSCECCRRR